MIKLLLFALIFYVSYNLLGALLRGLKGPTRQVPPEKTASGEEMVRDPQCGTFLPRSDALHKSVRGQTHYFCSQKCRDDYLAQTK